MNRRFFIIAGVILAVIAVFAVLGYWGNADWTTHSEITRVVPGENGETLIIQDGGRHGFFPFFPFFPFFLFFPLFWILAIGGFFALFGRRRWGGGPPFGPGRQDRNAWLADWHQRQHAGAATEPDIAPESRTPPES